MFFNLSLAISQYVLEISKPIYLLPNSLHAIAVVPEPINGSQTIESDLVVKFKSSLINSIGFCVG